MIAWGSVTALRIRSICAGSAASVGALCAITSVRNTAGAMRHWTADPYRRPVRTQKPKAKDTTNSSDRRASRQRRGSGDHGFTPGRSRNCGTLSIEGFYEPQIRRRGDGFRYLFRSSTGGGHRQRRRGGSFWRRNWRRIWPDFRRRCIAKQEGQRFGLTHYPASPGCPGARSCLRSRPA